MGLSMLLSTTRQQSLSETATTTIAPSQNQRVHQEKRVREYSQYSRGTRTEQSYLWRDESNDADWYQYAKPKSKSLRKLPGCDGVPPNTERPDWR